MTPGMKLIIPIALVAAMAFACGGCSHKSSSKPKGTTYHYIITGKIMALPVPGQGRQLQISAGPIKHWVRMSGKSGVMPAMVMPYQLASDVHTKGLKVGERIVFHYEVNWQQDVAQITSIKPAPPGH